MGSKGAGRRRTDRMGPTYGRAVAGHNLQRSRDHALRRTVSPALRHALQVRAAGGTGVRVQVGDVRLYFDVEGAQLVPDGTVMRERPTLLLLHGGPGFDHTQFKPQLQP